MRLGGRVKKKRNCSCSSPECVTGDRERGGERVEVDIEREKDRENGSTEGK